MQVLHTADEPSNGFQYATMSILFSIEEPTIELSPSKQVILDDFFDSLKWDNILNPETPASTTEETTTEETTEDTGKRNLKKKK